MGGKTLRYGTRRGQVGELWWPSPESRPAGDLPVVVLVHGGFWRAPYTKTLMRGLARSITEHGWVAWNIEYRRVGFFGGGGGWPNTFDDVAAAVEVLEAQPGLDLERVVTCGHSAGGHLALWLAARAGLAEGSPDGPVRVPVRGVVALAGVSDLELAYELDLGRGAVSGLLGGGPDVVPERYASASPAARLPLGVPQVLVHGADDTVVPATMSRAYVDRATDAGDPATFVPVPGGHREMLRASGAGWIAALEHLARLIT
jgi:acetyl esterase/lipase